MTTVRRLVEKALYDLENEWGGSGAGIFELHQAIDLLDKSREVTEKVTTPQDRPVDLPADHFYPKFLVTSHKARVVLDD